jgi:anaerobic ribonucleoside-triphosphate reductase
MDLQKQAMESDMKLEGGECSCPFCGSNNAYGISRIVGYYSPVQNWNAGKEEEFNARQRGDYKI